MLRPFLGHTDQVSSVAISPDARHVLSGSKDRTLILWETKSGRIVLGPLKGHTESVTTVAFSPSGKCFASGSYDHTIRTWNTETGDVMSVFEGHADVVHSIAVSPDGTKIASGCKDCTVRVLDLDSGGTVFGPFGGHVKEVLTVAFSLDGKLLASGSADDIIRIWDLQKKDSRNEEASPNWAMDASGWVKNEKKEILMWVPPDQRRTVKLPQNTALLNCEYWTNLDFQNAALGNRWQECFKSR